MKKKSTQGTRSSKKKTEPVLNVLSPLHPDNPDYKKSQETEITIYEREKDELVIKLLAELRSKNFTRRQMQDIYNTIRFLDGRSVQEGMDLINVSFWD
jgi:hypothetical protein